MAGDDPNTETSIDRERVHDVRKVLWEVSSDLYVTIGPDGNYCDANPAWTSLLGYEQEQVNGMPSDHFAHPNDKEIAKEGLAATIEHGSADNIELRVMAANRTYHWIDWTAIAHHDLVFAMGRLVDEKKARQRLLAKRTKERDRLWNSLQNIYVIIGLDGHYRDTNPAWEAQLDYPDGIAVGRPFDDLIHPDDREAVLAQFARVVEGERLDDYTVRMLHADGTYRRHLCTVFRDGDVVLATARDVTDEYEKAEVLKQTEAALRQAQKLDSIGQLTGGIAHDFNNLLMAINSSLTILDQRLPTEAPLRKYVANAREAADRGASLTQRMLAFARKQDLRVMPVDVDDLLANITPLLQRSLGPEITLLVESGGAHPYALVDANQLEMAILNLCVNARDAMDGHGTVAIKVRCSDCPDLPDGTYLHIDVIDSGCGMNAETLDLAKDPFFTTKGVGKGTGLGLSMVHGLAKQLGGQFTLNSQKGEGTVATIILPVANSDDVANEMKFDMQNTTDTPPATTTKTILAVDDDALVLMGTAGMLEDMGHIVLEAASGAEALATLVDHPEVDCVVTDQAMPNMRGVELAKRIRETRPNLPVILATGYADMPDDASEFIVARLEKPFTSRMLERTIEDALA